jgi:hypothetical protein
MGFCNLDDVQQDGQRLSLYSEMHGDCCEGMMVRGGPTVSGEIQFPVVLLPL